MDEQWYAGSNEEWFNLGPFDSREEAISEAGNNWPDREFFFIGKRGAYKPFGRDFVEELLELEACDVNDECGSDASDNWPPTPGRGPAVAEANEKIGAILMELCGECTVFPIIGSERIQKQSTR